MLGEGVLTLEEVADRSAAGNGVAEKILQSCSAKAISVEVGQFAHEAADSSHRLAITAARKSPADYCERIENPFQAEPHLMRKVGIYEEKLDHPLGLHPADIEPLVGLVGAALLQHGSPLERAHG